MSETSTDKVVPLSVFKSLVQLAGTVHKKVASANGELGQRVKENVENQNLHAGAFGLFVRLNRMPEDKRNEFIRNFDIYCDWGTEHIWAGDHLSDLVEMAKKPDPVEVKASADEAAAAVNTARLESGIKPLDADPEEQATTATVTPIAGRKGLGAGKGKLQ